MAVKLYSYDAKTQLTKNFNISEFRCKCYGKHNIKNDITLVEKVQAMLDMLPDAVAAYISSGHRCPTHDRNVGGSGYGPHVDGYAMDVSVRKKDGTFYDTKTLSCIAQDMGFMGIANITYDFQWIHLDMKPRVYKGDERGGNYNTVTTDFYSYYGISHDTINKLLGRSLGNNNVSSTSNSTKINNKDTSTSKFVYSNKYDAEIKNLQQILVNKGYALVIDGYAGPNTYAAVKKMTIDYSDRGPLTGWVQQRLANKGYYKGMIDGISGNQTMEAIKKFQTDSGLKTGYLGGTDWYYLIK